jgi:hypothetical protein
MTTAKVQYHIQIVYYIQLTGKDGVFNINL